MAAKRTLTPKAFIKAAAGKTFGGAFLVYGPDDYIKGETIRLAVGQHVPETDRGFAVTHLLGSQTDTREISAAAQAVPMLGSRLAVVIHDAQRLAAAHKARLPGVLAAIAHPALVIFAGPERVDRRTAFYKWFADHGRAVSCDPLNDKQAEIFARRELESAGKAADPTAVGRLLARVGADAGRLVREIEKLALYVGERESVTADDIEIVTGHTADSTPEELMHAILAADTARAMRLTSVLQSAGLESTSIIGRLTMHMLDLLRAASARAADPWKLAGALKIPVVRSEELLRWLKLVRRERIADMVAHLADAEALARSGRAEPDAVLMTLLPALCQTPGAVTYRSVA